MAVSKWQCLAGGGASAGAPIKIFFRPVYPRTNPESTTLTARVQLLVLPATKAGAHRRRSEVSSPIPQTMAIWLNAGARGRLSNIIATGCFWVTLGLIFDGAPAYGCIAMPASHLLSS